MRSIVRWEPFNDLISLRDAMDHLFEESLVHPPRSLGTWSGNADLALDMYEQENEVVVKASVPGVKPENLDVTIIGDTLTIKGAIEEENEVRDENYIRRERRCGSFSRSIALPEGLNADNVDAVFENGVLTLHIPRSEEVKPKSVKVKSQ